MIVSYATLVMSSYSSNNNNNTVVFLLLLLLLLLCRPSFVRFSPLYQTKPLSSFDVIFISSPPHIIGVLFSAVNKGSKKRLCSPRRRPRTTPRGRFWWRYEHDHHTPGEPTPKRQKRDFGRRRHEYYVPKVIITFLGTTSMKRSMTTMH